MCKYSGTNTRTPRKVNKQPCQLTRVSSSRKSDYNDNHVLLVLNSVLCIAFQAMPVSESYIWLSVCMAQGNIWNASWFSGRTQSCAFCISQKPTYSINPWTESRALLFPSPRQNRFQIILATSPGSILSFKLPYFEGLWKATRKPYLFRPWLYYESPSFG